MTPFVQLNTLVVCTSTCPVAWNVGVINQTSLCLVKPGNACADAGHTEGSGREQWRRRHQICTGCCCTGAALCCLPCLRLPGPQPAHPGRDHLPSQSYPPRHQGRQGKPPTCVQHYKLLLCFAQGSIMPAASSSISKGCDASDALHHILQLGT